MKIINLKGLISDHTDSSDNFELTVEKNNKIFTISESSRVIKCNKNYNEKEKEKVINNIYGLIEMLEWVLLTL